eukprot:m.38060 g.38060  ORF g.38060 m.38060 type:complete len:305 (+) comp11455_c0_seq3:261-1175(+)
MCIVFAAWQASERYELVIASNRDEFYHRKTQSCDWWDPHSYVLGGYDLERDQPHQRHFGTWLGVTKDGRVAVLTNVRDAIGAKSPRSRGVLVRDFLLHPNYTPAQYCHDVASTMEEFEGFNLLAFDLGASQPSAAYVTNRGHLKGSILEVPAGIHGLSNASLNDPWFKVKKGKERLSELDLTQPEDELIPDLFEMLSDEEKAPMSELPDTGLPVEVEYHLSSMLIHIEPEPGSPMVSQPYGTRSQSVVLVSKDGSVVCVERSREYGGDWVERRFHFNLEPSSVIRKPTKIPILEAGEREPAALP